MQKVSYFCNSFLQSKIFITLTLTKEKHELFISFIVTKYFYEIFKTLYYYNDFFSQTDRRKCFLPMNHKIHALLLLIEAKSEAFL